MAIEFDCLACGRHYDVPDALAGKRAVCKACKSTMTVPMPAVAIDDGPPDFDNWAALEAAATAESHQPPVPSPAYGGVPRPPPSLMAGGGGGAPAPYAAPSYRPNPFSGFSLSRLGFAAKFWGIVAILVALLLFAGSVSDVGAWAAFAILLLVGLLSIVVAYFWGVVAGFRSGFRVASGLLLAGPVMFGAAFAITYIQVKNWDPSQNYNGPPLISSALVIGSYLSVLGGALLGLIFQVRSFRWPCGIALSGVLMFFLSILPLRSRIADAEPGTLMSTLRGGKSTSPNMMTVQERMAKAADERRAMSERLSRPMQDAERQSSSAGRLSSAPRSFPQAPGFAAGSPDVQPPTASDTTAESNASARRARLARDAAARRSAQVDGGPPQIADGTKSTRDAESSIAGASPIPRSAAGSSGEAVAGTADPRRLQVKWNSAWDDARVIRHSNGWLLIEYDSDRSTEWVPKWRSRPVGSTVDDLPLAKPEESWNRKDAPAPTAPPPPRPKR